jgi:hypothetical protein
MGGFSLWFRPHPFAQTPELVQNLLSSLCSLHNEQIFTAHVTLAGEFEGEVEDLKVKAKQIADQCQSELTLPIERVQCGTIRFQCIYLVCKQITRLMEIGNASRRIFGVGQGQEYFPHLSLLYSNTMPQSVREQIVQELQTKKTIEIVKNNGIVMSSIELWDTHSDNEGEWKCVATFPLAPETRT